MNLFLRPLVILLTLFTFAACAPNPSAVAPTIVPATTAAAPVGAPLPTDASTKAPATLKVIAVETFLADIAQNIAGDRVEVASLMPVGLDPHAFEPTPQDIIQVAESTVLIINGAGVEAFLNKLLENAGGERLVIDASSGLTMREIQEGEPIEQHEGEEHEGEAPEGQEHKDEEHAHADDPHFWLDPISVIKYAENIRDGLTAADPAGAEIYKANTAAYIDKLRALDAEIRAQVETIPDANRKLVTDHDTFGYYADRYGFEIIGMLIPSFSSADTASARQLAELLDNIKGSGVKAIFLETSTNPQLAQQVAQDTGVLVVTDLYTHSLSDTNGPAPTYLDMLKYDTERIVENLR